MTVSAQKKKIIGRIALVLAALIALGVLTVLLINNHVKSSVAEKILTAEEAATLSDVDCILVLGCGAPDGKPGPRLTDRLSMGVELYYLGASDKLLMSGDHGQDDYDEVNPMKNFAIDAGVPSEQIFMDHAGFSTYESMYRARDIFLADRIIIVTQKYHLYRALYIAEALGLEAYGVPVEKSYPRQTYYDFREVLARNKDFVYSAVHPAPTYEGEAIPVSGNGDLTNDRPTLS